MGEPQHHTTMANDPHAYSEQERSIIFDRLLAFNDAKRAVVKATRATFKQNLAPDAQASLESKRRHLQACLRTLLDSGLSMGADVIIRAGTALNAFLESIFPETPMVQLAGNDELRNLAERRINVSSPISGPDGKDQVSIKSVRGIHLFAIDAPTHVAAQVQAVIWKLYGHATRYIKHQYVKSGALEKLHRKRQELEDYHADQDGSGKTTACDSTTGRRAAGGASASSAGVRAALGPGAGIPALELSPSTFAPATVSAASDGTGRHTAGGTSSAGVHAALGLGAGIPAPSLSSSMGAPRTVTAAAHAQPLQHDMNGRGPLKKRSRRGQPSSGHGHGLGGFPVAGGGPVVGNAGVVGIPSAGGGALGRTGQDLVASRSLTDAGTTGDVNGASGALVDGTAAQAAASAPSTSSGETSAAKNSVKGRVGSSQRVNCTREGREPGAKLGGTGNDGGGGTGSGSKSPRVPRRPPVVAGTGGGVEYNPPTSTDDSAAGEMVTGESPSNAAKAPTTAAAAADSVGVGVSAASFPEDGAEGVGEFKVGDIVEYRWGRRGDWYRCVVIAAAGEGKSQEVELEFLSRRKRKGNAGKVFSEVLKVEDLEADRDVAAPGTHLDDEYRKVVV